jgi:hypothetical protein
VRRRFVQYLAAIVGLVSSGCAGFVGARPISVAIDGEFKFVSVSSGAITLTATVEHASSGVSWSLTANGQTCAPVCGTLTFGAVPSLTATYTPPSILPQGSLAHPTITATSASDGSASDSFSFYINTPQTIAITLTNIFQSIDAGAGAVETEAQVANDPSNNGVTWTLTAGGVNCSPSCGTIASGAAPSFAASYTPPSSAPGGGNNAPTITATSVTDISKTVSFSFTIEAGSGGGGSGALQLLDGQFAFLLRGFDSTGAPTGIAGSFTADGAGNITAGEIDVNHETGITPTLTGVAGSYTVATSFNNVPRGAITFSSPAFPGTGAGMPGIFRYVLSADGTRGNLIEFDSTGDQMTGFFVRQDISAFSLASTAGTFAFGLDSDAPADGRVVEAGEFSLFSSGDVSSGLADESQAGAPAPIFSAAAVTGGLAGAPDSAGRAGLTLASGGQSTIYAAYIVNASEILLLEDDAGGAFGTVLSGVAKTQQPLNANSINGASVFQMTGIDFPSGTNGDGPTTIIGVLSVSGGNTFSVIFDSNDLGSISAAEETVSGSVSFDPATGRATVSIPGGFDGGFLDSVVCYLYDAGKGFILDADPSNNNGVTNEALSGSLTAQASGPFAEAMLAGNMLVRNGGTPTADNPSLIAAIDSDSGGDSFSGIADADSLTAGTAQSGLAFDGTFALSDAAAGRGTAMVQASSLGDFSSNGSYPVVFYMIGPDQMVAMGAQSGIYSGIVNFDPQ